MTPIQRRKPSNKRKKSRNSITNSTERGGFEPPLSCPKTHFECVTINHSDTSPRQTWSFRFTSADCNYNITVDRVCWKSCLWGERTGNREQFQLSEYPQFLISDPTRKNATVLRPHLPKPCTCLFLKSAKPLLVNGYSFIQQALIMTIFSPP